MTRNRKTSIALAAIIATLQFASAAFAGEGSVALEVETRTLEVGEAVDVALVCTNTGVPGLPQAALPDGLDLQLLNANPATQSRISIINGHRSQEVTYTYSMRLVALKAGSYTLGPVTVEIDGRKYYTNSVTIVVSDRAADSTPRGDRDLFVELEVEPRSLYVTESFTASLTIGIRKVNIGGRIYELDLLKFLDSRSTLSVFARERYSVNQRELVDSSGVRHPYLIYKLRKRIRAEQVGDSVVGPVFLKMDYPTQLRRDFWGDVDVARSRKATARAQAVTVVVKGAPVEGRPDSYTGAIGRFGMEVEAKPLHVEQHQPITLTITVKGSPVSGVAGPDLAAHADLVSRFDFAREELVGELEGSAKVFRRAVFPKLRGEQTIPPIEWSYFDPREERYVTLASDPIDIAVDPPSTTAAPIDLAEEEASAPREETLTQIAGGISPNYVAPAEVLADQTFALTPPWVLSLVLPPFLYAVLAISTRQRNRLRVDKAYARRRRALRNANERIGRAQRNGDPAARSEELAGALTGYLSDRFNLPPGPLTPAEARELLSRDSVDESLAAEVASFLEECEAARYAPGAGGDASASSAATRVRAWIKQIERSAP